MSDEPTREVTAVTVGDPVLVVDESRQHHHGLVTTVHGSFGGNYVPCINVIYVSGDPTRTDPYGRQFERMSSLQHYSSVIDMPQPGRYWLNP